MKKNKSVKTQPTVHFVKQGKVIKKNVKKGFWSIMDILRDLGRFIKNRPFFAAAFFTLSIPIISGIIGGAGIFTPALLAALPLISIFAIMSNVSGENSKFYNRRVEEVKQKIKEELNYSKVEEKSLLIEKSLITLRKEAFDNIVNEIFQKKVSIVDNRFQKLRDELRDIDRNILKTEVVSILSQGKDLNIITLEDDVVKQKMLHYITERLTMLDDELSVVSTMANKLCVGVMPETKDYLTTLERITKYIKRYELTSYNRISENMQADFEDIKLNIKKINDVYDKLTYKEIDMECTNIKELYSQLNDLDDRLKIFQRTRLEAKPSIKTSETKDKKQMKDLAGKPPLRDKNDIRNYFNVI